MRGIISTERAMPITAFSSSTSPYALDARVVLGHASAAEEAGVAGVAGLV